MKRVYVGLADDQAWKIEELRRDYEERYETTITHSSFIRRLLGDALERVWFGRGSELVESAQIEG